MKKQHATFVFILSYLWIMMILSGSIVLETFMVYPNIFYNPPQSLELAKQFMAIRAPSDFFPLFGFLSWVTGLGSLILGWQVRSARYWIAGSLLMIVADGLFSMLFFWPRNTVMFIEGTAVHSAAFLKQTAREFQALRWVRLALSLAGSILIFTGFLKFYRHSLISPDTLRQTQAASPGRFHAQRG
jgi:uncharacterized membrane protein